jgi:aryl-alcohol dehydrogenase-like predicted oxidoreductase
MHSHEFQSLKLPEGALPIGLGCSRLGSINGATGNEARELLRRALEAGVRFFDTSNIYAQGDSERLIGEVLGQRDDCIVCSKAGKYLDWKMRALVPLKGLIRAAARQSSQVKQGTAAARSKPMHTRWDGPFLLKCIDDSLKRLNRQQIEVFLLHSPEAEVIRRGEAIGALEMALKAGKVGMIGVAVDDVQSAESCLLDSRIRVLQLPLRPGEKAFDKVLTQAASQGVTVIAREILGGAQVITGAVDPVHIAHDRIVGLINRPGVSLPLVGTTKIKNLDASIKAARTVGRS